ncbi:MAG: uracil-DNA glycosylase family protein [Xanthomonadales bacterium]|nr:uracil-DNA glycosylase family protein [Xanthomonadales bacterium]
MSETLQQLAAEARACRLCAGELPRGPRPVFQVGRQARVLVAGQAPGARVHESGVPFDDASGERLRHWMGVDRDTFYDPRRVAILPMGFCYPGRGGSGDLPPLRRCAATWRKRMLAALPGIRLTLVVGRHAMDWHLPGWRGSLADAVRAHDVHGERMIPLPHPSPRNNPWLAAHPWFEREVVPSVRDRVASALR